MRTTAPGPDFLIWSAKSWKASVRPFSSRSLTPVTSKPAARKVWATRAASLTVVGRIPVLYSALPTTSAKRLSFATAAAEDGNAMIKIKTSRTGIAVKARCIVPLHLGLKFNQHPAPKSDKIQPLKLHSREVFLEKNSHSNATFSSWTAAHQGRALLISRWRRQGATTQLVGTPTCRLAQG